MNSRSLPSLLLLVALGHLLSASPLAAAGAWSLGRNFTQRPMSSDGSTVVFDAARFRNGATEILPKPAGQSGTLRAQTCSGDGSVVAGWWAQPSVLVPFRWAGESSIVLLPLPASYYVNSTHPVQVSEDGSVVTGLMRTSSLPDIAFRWTQATGAVALPLPAGAASVEKIHFAADGASVLGLAVYPDGNSPRPFRWTLTSGAALLPLPPGWKQVSGFTAISADATSAAGSFSDDSLAGGGYFLWTLARGWERLSTFSELYPLPITAISADGAVLAGTRGSLVTDGTTATIPIPNPTCISADGSVVAGTDHLGRTLLWDRVHGLARLSEALEGDGLSAESSAPFQYGSPLQVVRVGDQVSIVVGGFRSIRLATLRLGATAADPFGGAIFAPAQGVKPAVTITESYSEVAGPTELVKDEQGQLVPVTLPLVRFNSGASLTLPLGGLDLATVTGATQLTLRFGSFDFSRPLREATTLDLPRGKATFALDNDGSAQVIGLLTATWTAKALTLKITHSVKETTPFTIPIAGFFTGYNTFFDPLERTAVYPEFPEPMRAAFGDRNGTTYLLASARQALVTRHDFVTYSARARFDATLPAFKVLSPAAGTLIPTPYAPVLVRLSGPLRDIANIEVRVNGGPWQVAGLALDPLSNPYNYDETFFAVRADVPLTAGNNVIGIRSVDDRGQRSGIVEIPVKHVRLSGSFVGLVKAADGAIVGTLRLTVGANAALTGAIEAGGSKFSLKGTVAANGTATLPIKLSKQQTVNLQLSIFPDGSVTLGSAAVDLGAGPLTSALTRQYPFAKPIIPFQAYAADVYGLLLPRDPASPAAGVPAGTGFANLTVSPTAGTRLVGKLADGTAISHGGLLDETGAIPVWLPLYPRGAGRLAGVLAFGDVPGTSHLAGKLQWVKPPVPRTVHPLGFTTQLDALGARASQDITFPVPTAGQPDSRFVFSRGGLANAINVPANRGLPVPTVEKVTVRQHGVTFDSWTGLRIGTFFDVQAKKTRTCYLLSQPLLNRCEGFFVGENEGGLAQLLPGL